MWEFANQNPGTTFLICCVAAWIITRPFWLANRVLRSRNITACGWPPKHLDADGDQYGADDDDKEPNAQ